MPKKPAKSKWSSEAIVRVVNIGGKTTLVGVDEYPSRVWAIQLAAYERATTRNYEALRISALGGVDTDEQSLKLSGLYVSPACETAVFTPKFGKSRTDEKGITSRRGVVEQSSRPPRNILDALIEKEDLRHIVLGAAGTGKSSILRYLCLEWAKDFVAKKPTKPVPVMVELREFLGAREEHKFADLFAYLTSESGRGWFFDADTLLQKLKSGEAWLLVDGIDEAFATHVRQEICDWLRKFAHQHPEVRIIASSRIIGFQESDWIRHSSTKTLPVWQIHKLLPFDGDRIRQFVEKWFSHLPSGNESNRFGFEDVVKILEERDFLKPLAEVPLTLTMICAVRSRGIEPDSRCAVFKEAAKLFLQAWDNARGLPKEEAEVVRHWRRYGESARLAFFRSVALRMVRDGGPNNSNQITHGALRTILQEQFSGDATIDSAALADGILRLLCERNFLLTELPGGGFGFFHRAFLEYFVADAWADEFGNDFYEDLKGERQPFEVFFGEVIGPRWKDPTWHDTLRFLFGLLRPVPALRCLDLLAKQKPMVVNKDTKNPEPLGLVFAVDFLQEVESSFTQAEAGKKKSGAGLTKIALAELWKPAVFKYARSQWDSRPLAEANHAERVAWRRRALVALAANWRGNLDVAWEFAALLRVEVDWWDLESALGEALAVLAPGRSEMFWLLLDLVLEPVQTRIDEACGELATGGAGEAASVTSQGAAAFLPPSSMREAPDQKDAAVSGGARTRLGASRYGDGGRNAAAPWLVTLANRGANGRVRTSAARLAPFLEESVCNRVRRGAVFALAGGWAGEPETKAALLLVLIGVPEAGVSPSAQAVPPDVDEEVRNWAASELGSAWRDDADVKNALLRVLIGVPETGKAPSEQKVPPDSDFSMRYRAMRHLGEGWKGDTEVKAALERVATGKLADGSFIEKEQIARNNAQRVLDKWTE